MFEVPGPQSHTWTVERKLARAGMTGMRVKGAGVRAGVGFGACSGRTVRRSRAEGKG